MRFFLRVLSWLNLLDCEQKLSITNLAVYALVVKMLLVPTLDWPSVTAMIVTFTNYMHKRQTSDGASAAADSQEMLEIKKQYETAVVTQAKAIADIQAKLNSVSQLTDLMKLQKR